MHVCTCDFDVHNFLNLMCTFVTKVFLCNILCAQFFRFYTLPKIISSRRVRVLLKMKQMISKMRSHEHVFLLKIYFSCETCHPSNYISDIQLGP